MQDLRNSKTSDYLFTVKTFSLGALEDKKFNINF